MQLRRDIEDIKLKSHEEKMDILKLSDHLKAKIASFHSGKDDNLIEQAFAKKLSEKEKEIEKNKLKS